MCCKDNNGDFIFFSPIDAAKTKRDQTNTPSKNILTLKKRRAYRRVRDTLSNISNLNPCGPSLPPFVNIYAILKKSDLSSKSHALLLFLSVVFNFPVQTPKKKRIHSKICVVVNDNPFAFN